MESGDGGSEFQATGAAVEKLCRPSLFVLLIRGTNGSPHTAERSPERREIIISRFMEDVAEVYRMDDAADTIFDFLRFIYSSNSFIQSTAKAAILNTVRFPMQ